MDSFFRPDLATLMLTTALMAPLIALANCFLWWQTRDRALLWWAAGALAVAVGTVCLPGDGGALLARLAGGSSLILSQWLFYRGARALHPADRPGFNTFDRVFVGVLMGANLGSLLLNQALFGETHVAFAMAALSFACGYTLLIQHTGRARESAYFVGAIFAVSGLLNMAIGLMALVVSQAAIVWPLAHTANLVLLIGWSFGFLMLIGQRNQERVADLADHDELTGANTRRAVLEKGRYLFTLAARKDTGLSVMMLDLDFFKQINDAHGHAVGDQVLKRFSAVVRACLRGSDVFGRLGGEEFCVLLPDTDQDGALRVAERIRSGFADGAFEHHGQAVNATVSIGVAVSRADPGGLEALMTRADEALYLAKHHGRDCVVGASESEQQIDAPLVRLVWDARFRSGNGEIDREHEYLFSWANALLGKMQKQADPGVIEADVRELLHWTSEHFRHEEAILGALNWDGLARHALQHRALEARGAILLAEVQAGRCDFSKLLDFVVLDIISGHLGRHDTQYFAVTKAA